jgi:hypothetical protein
MEWTRSETLALASHSCALCQGLGLRLNETAPASLDLSGDPGARPAQPCNCVLRNIFRACYARFRECAIKEKFISQVSLEAVQGSDHKRTWGRKDEEYIADFCLVSRRSLSKSEHLIFKYHYLLGADWKLCCKKLKMDRGNFFHTVYKIEQRLGRVFRELKPYALYPVKEYFSGPIVPVRSFWSVMPKVVPIRPQVPTGGNFDIREEKAA